MAAYWKATNANTKRQLIIFDAVVRSKLMYGLETAALTVALKEKTEKGSLPSGHPVPKVV